MTMQRMVRFFVLMSLGVMLGGAWLWYHHAGPGTRPPPRFGTTIPAGIDIGGPFRLTDHSGGTVTDAALQGRLSLLYFGYTFCPDFCPTDLQKIATVLDGLGDTAARVQPFFVTIDPARDTAARLADHVALFHPRITGLTGSAEQVDRAAKAYKAYYRKAEIEGSSDYLMDHSLYTYVMGPDGRLLALFGNQATVDDLVAALRHYIATLDLKESLS